MHPLCVSRLNCVHVSISSAFRLGIPCTSISRNSLHTRVHALPSPVSSAHSRMLRLSTLSCGCDAPISCSALLSSSHLQNESIPIHSAHPPSTFLLPPTVRTSSQCT